MSSGILEVVKKALDAQASRKSEGRDRAGIFIGVSCLLREAFVLILWRVTSATWTRKCSVHKVI